VIIFTVTWKDADGPERALIPRLAR